MYGIVFWTSDQNSIDVLVVAEQCLLCIKDFSVSHSIPPVSRLGMHKRLGEDTDETDQRGITCHMMLYSAIEAGRKRRKRENPD